MGADREAKAVAKKSILSGLVSAAADNDPTTVGTIAVAGAVTVYGLEWVLVLIVPMLIVVQMLATHLAGVSGKGLQAAVRSRYHVAITWISLGSIVAVNLITIGADLQAGAASLDLLTGVPEIVWAVPLALLIGAILSWENFDRTRAFFSVLPLAFLAYTAAAVLAHPDWHAVARGFIPHLGRGKQTMQTILALFGTLLTAYAYFWQTVEVATDRPPRRRLLMAELATIPGVLFTFVILWFILTATAATLGVHHHQIETAQDAARALAPFAGRWAPIVFAIGLFGSAFLAVPVLAAGTANAMCETFRWRGSLDDSPRKAPQHYAVVYVCLAIGATICFLHVPVVTLLFIASIAGGLATPLTLALMMLLERDHRTTRGHRGSPWLVAAGWGVTAIVTLAGIAFFVTGS
ncbi:MAG: divalent metal cation transporter [Candidatus Eremiobacteraeota bacterium]|nr:divalent metal cation transporter [Candidatus Eremiobacteraeota bacterium]